MQQHIIVFSHTIISAKLTVLYLFVPLPHTRSDLQAVTPSATRPEDLGERDRARLAAVAELLALRSECGVQLLKMEGLTLQVALLVSLSVSVPLSVFLRLRASVVVYLSPSLKKRLSPYISRTRYRKATHPLTATSSMMC